MEAPSREIFHKKYIFSSRRRHTIWNCDWSSDVCSSDLITDRPGDEYELLTVVLVDLGGKTEMQFRQTGGHNDAAGYAGARDGWLVFFDTLADLLARSEERRLGKEINSRWIIDKL